MNRALPGQMVDKIRDGVTPEELADSGDKAVYTALLRTASSAAQRGWDCWEWQEFVLEDKSKLGHQARLKNGRRRRSRTELRAFLDDIWDKATEWLSTAPPAWKREDAAAQVRRRVRAVMAVLERPECQLLDADRRLLQHACSRAIELNTTRVALPKLATSAATGLGEKSTVNSLNRLDSVGLLILVERGRPGGPKSRKRRANLYELADAERVDSYLYRGTRSVGPGTQDCGTPSIVDRGTPTCGTPTSTVTGAGSPRHRRAGVHGPEQCDESALADEAQRQTDPVRHHDGRRLSDSTEAVAPQGADGEQVPSLRALTVGPDARRSRLLPTSAATRPSARTHRREGGRRWDGAGTGPRNRRG